MNRRYKLLMPGLVEFGSGIEAGLQIVVCFGFFLDFKVKVSIGIIQCPPTGFNPLHHTSVALMAQYLKF
jgi:hypothetical protein